MRLFSWRKDGGPESHVSGLFIIEIKSLFSVVLLRFRDGSRDAYHSHAFDAWSWVLHGRLDEYTLDGGGPCSYRRQAAPIKTPFWRFHKVVSHGTTWVLSFRGPWRRTWHEWIPEGDDFLTLTHGRERVS